jgi:hypothetical protein
LDKPIRTTRNHPFWSVDRDAWIRTCDLLPGETLRTLDGTITVRKTKLSGRRETVHNLQVEGDESYFVSPARLLVHNSCARLVPIHSKKTLQSGSNKHSWDFWSSKSNDEIIKSLSPGHSESLKVKPDGRVMQGNTRITILMERGYPVDNLPRELLP